MDFLCFDDPKDQRKIRIALIHSAIMEFITTNAPDRGQIFPILNRILLLVQKPLVFVLFRGDGKRNHTILFPAALRVKVNEFIDRNLTDSEGWIIPIGDSHQLGVLHVGFEFIRPFEDTRADRVGRIDTKRTSVSKLSHEDFNLISELFDSLNSQSDQMRGFFLREWIAFEDVAAEQAPEYLTRVLPQKSLKPEDVEVVLRPIWREVDLLYREFRGGQPGDFSANSPPPGAPVLWRRRFQNADGGPRPPTIAFYAKLRSPNGYFSTVPIITRAQCDDEAAMLFYYGQERRDDILEYLHQLNISKKDAREALAKALVKDSWKPLSDVILAACGMASMLARSEKSRRYSSTYPAFQSGISTFVDAKANTIRDRFCYGPDFLAEQNRGEPTNDTAFHKPTMVAGYPLFVCTTKTRTGCGLEDIVDFDSFYYNYSFQMGVVTKRLSRRLRRVCENTYLDQVAAIWRHALVEWASTSPNCIGEIASRLKLANNPQAELADDYDSFRPTGVNEMIASLNLDFERLASILPYGKVKIGWHGFDEPTQNSVKAFDVWFNFWIFRNEYFEPRTLIDYEYEKPQRVGYVLEQASLEAEQEFIVGYQK